MNYGEQMMKETERYEVEYRLRERERFLRTLIGNLPGVVYRCRIDEKFTSEFLSDGCQELTGYTAEELVQTRAAWDKIIHPDDRERIRTEIRALMKDNAAFGTPPLEIAYRIVARDDSIKHVRDRFRFINDSAGKIIALEGFIADITARTLADERARVTESRYRLLAENMCDLVCLHDLDGLYTYVSPSSFALLEYRPPELVGTSPFDLIHSEEINCVREDMHERLLKGETDLTIDYRMRKKSGEYVWVETMAQILTGEDGKPTQLLTVSRDISKRKIAEQERAEAQEEIARFYFNEQTARAEAEAAHKEADTANRAKDEFLQLISHEFRTPLTTIKTLARIMQREDESIEERNEYLETIAAECDRQIDMILNLLDVARIEEGSIDLHSEPVDVNRMLRSCDKIERYAANARGQTFNVEYDETLPKVRGDEKAMRRALCSIIENAIKYTPFGGAVSITTELVQTKKRSESPAQKTFAENNIAAEVAIKISDTGRGIHAEDIPRLFRKFYRGKKTVPHDHTTDGTPDDAMGRAETPGVGLGLYLAKRLISELGGRIEAESEVGRGTCFTIFFAVWNDKLDRLDTIDEYGFDEGTVR
ncbi:MAG: PAS domain-containing protein [Acidobacteria bacterium]|jgi:PAS domain S-box-containing protein|nr:PAS domain-containing protein [Acidobacteriota bacterium]